MVAAGRRGGRRAGIVLASVATVVLAGLSPVTVAAPAAAVNGRPEEGPVVRTDLHLPDRARAMAGIGSQLWVTSGDRIDVFTTNGVRIASFTGIAGADRIVTDGTTVFVNEPAAAAIVRVDIATLTLGTPLVVQDCPTTPVLVGRRLFYAYGCSVPGGLAWVDVDDPTQAAVTPSGLAMKAQLVAAGSELVAYDRSASPTPSLKHYTVASDGSLTDQLVPDATHGAMWANPVVRPDGSGLTVLWLPYDQAIDYPLPGLAAGGAAFSFSGNAFHLAYSRDGTRIAVGTAPSGGGVVQVFDVASGTLLATDRLSTDAFAVSAVDTLYSMTFSADGSRLYWLTYYAGTVHLATASTTAPALGSVTLSAVGPTKYGAAATLTVRTPGRPSTWVHLVLRTGSKDYPADIRTNASGVATLPAYAPRRATVRATTAATFGYTAASASTTFTVPAATTVALSGGYKTVRSVRYAHRIGDISASVVAYPQQWTQLDVTVQVYTGGAWRQKARQTFATSLGGGLRLRLTTGFPRATRMRFLIRNGGTVDNTPAPVVLSQVFIVA